MNTLAAYIEQSSTIVLHTISICFVVRLSNRTAKCRAEQSAYPTQERGSLETRLYERHPPVTEAVSLFISSVTRPPSESRSTTVDACSLQDMREQHRLWPWEERDLHTPHRRLLAPKLGQSTDRRPRKTHHTL